MICAQEWNADVSLGAKHLVAATSKIKHEINGQGICSNRQFVLHVIRCWLFCLFHHKTSTMTGRFEGLTLFLSFTMSRKLLCTQDQ